MNESRFAALLIILIALAALRKNLVPASWFAGILRQLPLAVPGVGTRTDASLDSGLWFLTGFLLVANKASLFIRSRFHRFHLEPRVEADGAAGTPGGQLDRQECSAGRIIGILERWLMYSVPVGSQNINVLALLITAMGFARFRQMDERAFAEYVLTGTLASTLLTVLVAQSIGLSGGCPPERLRLPPTPPARRHPSKVPLVGRKHSVATGSAVPQPGSSSFDISA